MPEKNLRYYLIDSFHALRNTISARHKLEKNPDYSHCRAGNCRHTGDFLMQNRAASVILRAKSPSTSREKSSRDLRHVSEPLITATTATTTINDDIALDRKELAPCQGQNNSFGNPEAQKALSARRGLAALKRSQTAVGIRKKNPYSRLPTPSEPPKGELYSHLVYQKEGRRSVLSSLGERHTNTLVKDIEPASQSNPENKENVDRHGIRQSKARDQVAASQLKKLLRQRYPGIPGTKSPTKIPRYSPHLSIQRKKGHENLQYQSIPKIVTVQAQTSALPSRGSSPNDGDFPFSEKLYVRKVRAWDYQEQQKLKHHHHPPRDQCSQTKQRYPASHSDLLNGVSITSDTMMAAPRRIRLTRGFENLRQKTQSKEISSGEATTRVSRLPRVYHSRNANQSTSPKNQQIDTQDSPRASSTSTLTPAPTRTPTPASLAFDDGDDAEYAKMASPVVSARRVGRTYRMAPSRDCSWRQFIPRSRRPLLTTAVDSCLQVREAQPKQYWLGRFVTLTSAFQYEDSFNEPDIASGFSMLSSYSRPFQNVDEDQSNYRIRRAFMVLENYCTTEEASESLRSFRYSYIKRFGARWMN